MYVAVNTNITVIIIAVGACHCKVIKIFVDAIAIIAYTAVIDPTLFIIGK